MEYKSGSLWNKNGRTAILQELTGGLFCLFEYTDKFQLIFDEQHPGKWQYSFEEVPELLKDWQADERKIVFIGGNAPSTQAVSEGGMETKQFVTATGDVEEVQVPKASPKKRKGGA